MVQGDVDPGVLVAELAALANNPPQGVGASAAQAWTAALRGVHHFVANLPKV